MAVFLALELVKTRTCQNSSWSQVQVLPPTGYWFLQIKDQCQKRRFLQPHKAAAIASVVCENDLLAAKKAPSKTSTPIAWMLAGHTFIAAFVIASEARHELLRIGWRAGLYFV